MKRITFFILFTLFSVSVFADSKILDVKKTIDQLGSDLITAQLAPANMSNKEILGMIKETEELNSYLYQSFLEVDYTSEKLEEYYFNNDSWYPQFCYEFSSKENISECYEAISVIVKPLSKKFGFLYLNGDANSSDFKTMTLVFDTKEDSKKLIITLKVHEERN